MKLKILLNSILATSIIVSGCSTKPESSTTQSNTNQKKVNSQKISVTDEGEIKNLDAILNKDLDITSENKSMKATIKNIKIAKTSFHGEQIASLSNIETNKEYVIISLKVSVTNNTGTNANINTNMSHLLIKDTKEQLDQNGYTHTWNEPEYLPGAEKESTLLFISKTSKVEDIKNVSLNLEAPYVQGDYNKRESLTIDLNNIQ